MSVTETVGRPYERRFNMIEAAADAIASSVLDVSIYSLATVKLSPRTRRLRL